MIDKIGSSDGVEMDNLLKDLSETIKANEKNILNLPTSGETEDFEEHPPVVPAYYPSIACEVLFGEAKSLKERGDRFAKDSKWQEALECYSEALTHQEYRALYFNRAVCHFNLEKYYETVTDCTQALRLDEKYGKAYFKRGTAKEKLGDYYGACIDFQSSLICSQFQSRASWEAFTRIKPQALDDFYTRIGDKNGRARYNLVPDEEGGSEALPGSPSKDVKKKDGRLRLKYHFRDPGTSDVTSQVTYDKFPNDSARLYRLKVCKGEANFRRDPLLEEAVAVLLRHERGCKDDKL